MTAEVHRRSFDAFLSHAHQDRAFVDQLYCWLNDIAGFSIWYDALRMPGGTLFGIGLQKAVGESRGLLLVASSLAIDRGWVREELNVALDERANSSDFRIIALRIQNAPVGNLLRGTSWIDVPAGVFTEDTALELLRAFYPIEHQPDPRTSRDVYVSTSWHRADRSSGIAVCRKLAATGLRLVGDAKDQRGFRADRIKSIIESCGAFVAVIPYRGDDPAVAEEGPYRYFLREISHAEAAELPMVVIADPRVRTKDRDDSGWLRMETSEDTCSPVICDALDDLWTRWERPPRPHFVFLATDFDSTASLRRTEIRRLIERITGMPTIVGTEFDEPPIQQAILAGIKESFLVIADISGETESTFNLNVCIEAGMARACGATPQLLAVGKPRQPPFMLRDCQMTTYHDGLEELGLLHRILAPFRRRIINAELLRA